MAEPDPENPLENQFEAVHPQTGEPLIPPATKALLEQVTQGSSLTDEEKLRAITGLQTTSEESAPGPTVAPTEDTPAGPAAAAEPVAAPAPVEPVEPVAAPEPVAPERPDWVPEGSWQGPDGWYHDGVRVEPPAAPETLEQANARQAEEIRQLREQLQQTQVPVAERGPQEEDPFALTADRYSRKDLDGRISYVEKVVGATRPGDVEMDNGTAHDILDDLENMDLTDPDSVRQVARAADFLARRGGLNLHYIEGLQLQCPEVAGAMMKRLEGLTKFKKLLEKHNMKGFSFFELWRNTLKMSPAAAKWILIAALTLGGGVALAGLGPGYAKMLGGIATR